MNLEQRLEDLRARLALMQGTATLLILVAPTEPAALQNHRIVADIMRAGSLEVVDLGRISRQFGPAAWVEATKGQKGDVHLMLAIPESIFEASAFAALVNAEREHLTDLPGPVLLVVSRDMEDMLRKRAADFMTWAATVYELPEPTEFLAMARRLGAVPTSSQRHVQQEKPLRFLHISDFHLRPGLIQRYDQDKVLHGLIQFLARERIPLDAIFATGDLAFSGAANEYALVIDFLKKLLDVTGVDPQRMFVVPGNHDVDRRVGKWLLRTLPDPQTADAFFLEPGARDAHARKFEAYHKAMASFLGEDRKFGLGVGKEAVEMIEWDDARIAVASFNSAWFAQADSDLGKLWLGEANVAEAGDRLAEEKATFSIALMHHPMEHLDEQERDTVEERLERTFDVVLRGHLHKNKTKVVKSQRGGYVEVAGQATYQTSQWPNGCYIGEIRPCARTVKLTPYRFGKGTDPWVLDTTVFPDDAATNYAHTFEVPEKRIFPGTIRRAREQAAVEVVQSMSSNVKQQLAQELGWHDSARNKLTAQVEQRIERKAAVANEDSALWAKPEQAKKLEKAVNRAVVEEAFSKMPEVPKIYRNDPDFLEKAFAKVTPVILKKVAELQEPTLHTLRGILCAMLEHILDGTV
ncbi:MAG TPA: metallophosphoesterase, partial [Polyangium sp.]|nr:metallophosphoesterase [Polyangium sp.]